MPKLNRFLATSIIEDIRECVCVSNEIYSWVGKIEHLSWKFPTKTAKDINAMEIVKEHKGTAGEFYILLLELAYDRIQFLLRLILEFMDEYPFVEDFFKEVARIGRPGQLSLASIARLIWNRLKTMPESISQHMVKNREAAENEAEGADWFGRKVSRSSQASSTVNYCESCSVACEAILQVINAIERAFEENKLISAVAAERKHTKDDIYERTQWAVMSRLTEAVAADVETIFTRMRENNVKAETAGRDYEGKIRDLRAELSRKERQTDALESTNFELESRLENVGKRLDEAKRGKVAGRQREETFRGAIEDFRRRVAVLTGGNNILQSQVATLAENKLELENTVSRLRKELVGSRDACHETERRFQLLLAELKKENDLIKTEHEQKIDALQRNISELRAREETQENVEATKTSEPNEESGEEAILMPGDDPEVDMTRQLISNRDKIEVLSRQNDRLSKTLNRLRAYRLTAQTTTNGLNK